jgi:hypothetical protein
MSPFGEKFKKFTRINRTSRDISLPQQHHQQPQNPVYYDDPSYGPQQTYRATTNGFHTPMIVTQPLTEPGDRPHHYQSGQEVPPEHIRELRELIQKRYRLDLEIWNCRNCLQIDKHRVENMMIRSDAVLDKILAILTTWAESHLKWSVADGLKVDQITDRMNKREFIRWQGNPPWGIA